MFMSKCRCKLKNVDVFEFLIEVFFDLLRVLENLAVQQKSHQPVVDLFAILRSVQKSSSDAKVMI